MSSPAAVLLLLLACLAGAADDLDWYKPVEQQRLTQSANGKARAVRVCMPVWSARAWQTDRYPGEGVVAVASTDEIGRTDMAGPLARLAVEVNIPTDHRIGVIERPWGGASFDADVHLGVLRLRAYSAERVASRLRKALAAAGTGRVLVVVHGYNVGFQESVLRTAQVAYDCLFPGLPVCFTWPSGSGLGTARYAIAEANAPTAATALAACLGELAVTPEVTEIVVLAHSMGVRATLDALAAAGTEVETKVRGVALAAGDVGVGSFATIMQGPCAVYANRITVYASAQDVALKFSTLLHKGESRIGLTVPTWQSPPGVARIDASGFGVDFAKHSYYGDDDHIISDLHGLLGGVPCSQRPLLAPGTDGWLRMVKPVSRSQPDGVGAALIDE